MPIIIIINFEVLVFIILIVLILKSDAVRVLIFVGATKITAVIIIIAVSKILCLN